MGIRLVPMTPSEYSEYAETAIREYAHDNVLAGRWSADQAIEESRGEFARLLPDGPLTPGHHLLHVVQDPGELEVGIVWVFIPTSPSLRPAFIYDLRILPDQRRNGYGAAAMFAVEELARAQGATRIGLNVFGHNPGARRLYARRGYQTVAKQMSKALLRESPTSGPVS